MNNGINVLSLFDGISCGQIALERVGVKIKEYFASEIDKHAIKVTQHNYPNTIQLGSVLNVDVYSLPEIHLLIGGSPCQSFSFIGKKNGMSTINSIEVYSYEHYLELKEQKYEFSGYSYLFWEYIRILKEAKPKFFLLENVRMNRKWENVITNATGVPPIKINSNLVSAQNRQRIYWSNIHFNKYLDDKKVMAQDIKETTSIFNNPATIRMVDGRKKVVFTKNKMDTLTTFCGNPNGIGRPFWAKDEFFVDTPFDYSKVESITPIEAERLQTVPDNYTSMISNNRRFHALGNGWTVDVIAHIFKHLPYSMNPEQTHNSMGLYGL